MLRPQLVAASLLLVSIATSAPSLGQPATPRPPSSSAPTDAEALFHKGRELANTKDWAGAYDAFMRSQKLRPSYDTAGNLGHVAYKLSKFDEAAHYLSLSLRGMPASVSAERHQAVEHALRQAKKEVTAVHVKVEPSSAEVFVDGESRGAALGLAGPIFLMPGQHAIEARAHGFQAGRERIVATKGAERTLELRLQQAASSPAALPDSGLPATDRGAPREQGDPMRNGGSEPGVPPKTIALIAGGALTAISLGVGIGFEIDRASAKDEAGRLRAQVLDQLGTNGCAAASAGICSDLREANARRERSGDISLGGFVSSGVFAIGTAIVWLAWPDEQKAKANAAAVRIVSFADRQTRALGVAGSF